MYPNSKELKNTEKMSDESAEMFLYAVLVDLKQEESPQITEEEYPLSCKIIKKRIEVLKLPIQFTTGGYFAIAALADNPGKAVVTLCDCLNEYENKTVTAQMISELYPWGFYKYEVFCDIVDNWMKTKKHKWANIY